VKQSIEQELEFTNNLYCQLYKENLDLKNKVDLSSFIKSFAKNINQRHTPHIKGDLAEYLAQMYFLSQGYYVFNNVSQHGFIDFVAISETGEIRKIDVKCITRRKRDGGIINKCKTQIQKKHNVELFYICTETGENFFK
jgi:Holliday junction resolvase-like predicted endonuclease